MGVRQIAIEARDLVRVSSSITRPNNATPYAAKDSIAEVTTNNHFSWAVKGAHDLSGGKGVIERVIFTQSGSVANELDARLWLFAADVGEDPDNDIITFTLAEMKTRIGTVNLPDGDGATGAIVMTLGTYQDVTVDLPFAKLADNRTIFGVLEALNAFVPEASETFTIDLVIARY